MYVKETLYFVYSKEPSQWDGSFAHTKHIYKKMMLSKKTMTILC